MCASYVCWRKDRVKNGWEKSNLKATTLWQKVNMILNRIELHSSQSNFSLAAAAAGLDYGNFEGCRLWIYWGSWQQQQPQYSQVSFLLRSQIRARTGTVAFILLWLQMSSVIKCHWLHGAIMKPNQNESQCVGKNHFRNGALQHGRTQLVLLPELPVSELISLLHFHNEPRVAYIFSHLIRTTTL